MGLCLLKEAGPGGRFFAVNGAHVEKIGAAREWHGGPLACLLKFGFETGNFNPVGLGTPEEMQSLFMESSKIGFTKIELDILTGKNMRAAPLLINRPDRVALIRELAPEEIAGRDADAAAASEVFFSDGTSRIVAARPGTFAFRANANGRVPTLEKI